MKAKLFVTLFIVFFCALNNPKSFAQETTQPHTCGTDLDQILKDPDQWRAFQDFQKNLEAFRTTWQPNNDASNKTSDNPNESKYIIPVVVHVVYADPKDSISYDQAYSALLTMYNDFRKVPGSRGVGGGASDTKIEFVFASIDPNGNPTNGVRYYRVAPEKTNLGTFGADNEELKMRLAPSWNTQKYFNIWIVRAIEDGDNNPNTRILGYAQFPFSYNSGNGRFTDGFVSVHENFGTTGTSDRYISVSTHELGHCFNLFHTFQGGCGGSNCRTSGDNICDTPPSSVQFSRPVNRNNSCREQPYDKPDNPRNYMDYTSPFDAQNHFTLDQVAMFHSVFENRNFPHRFGLWQKSNLESVGASQSMKPRANFSASTLNACVGQEIEFSDFTMGMPLSWEWEFPGGEPSVSTSANPKVKYNAPGIYSVKMKVRNGSPFEDSTTKVNYIRIEDPNEISFEVTPTQKYLATFNETNPRDFPDKGWYLVDNDAGYPGSYSWDIIKRVNGYAKNEADGSGVIRFEHYMHSQFNQHDAFVTPIVKLKDMEGKVRLHFDLSYAILSAQDAGRPGNNNGPAGSGLSTFYTDSLAVYVSNGCDDQWQQLWQKGGLELQTVARTPATNNQGEGGDHSDPRAADWKTISINLPASFANSSQIRFKFETISGFGNNLYIDNIGVDNDITSASQQLLTDAKVSLYPNPTDGLAHMECYLQQPASVSYVVTDLQGRIVLSKPTEQMDKGLHTIELPMEKLTEGIYILQLTVNDQHLTEKIVKY